MLVMRSDTLMQAQVAANRAEDARVRRASVQGLLSPDGWDLALRDTQEAVTGILGDMHGTTPGRTSVRDILMHENRLRGLGIALLVAALAGCLVHGLAAQ